MYIKLIIINHPFKAIDVIMTFYHVNVDFIYTISYTYVIDLSVSKVNKFSVIIDSRERLIHHLCINDIKLHKTGKCFQT